MTAAAGAGAAAVVAAVVIIAITNHHNAPPQPPDMVIQAAPCTPQVAQAARSRAPVPAPAATVASPAPPLPTTSPPPIGTCRTVATVATFRFAPEADPLGFDCSLDAAKFAACTSPAIFRGLRPGPHVFLVRAVDVDSAGRPAAFRWVVLAKPPRPLPDLVVSFYDGTSVTVRNVGDGPAGPSTLLLGSAGYFAIPALGQQGEKTYRHLPCPAGGSSAIADAANQVIESSEGNNLAFGGPFACVPPVTISPFSGSASASTSAATGATTTSGPARTTAVTIPPTTAVTTAPPTEHLSVAVKGGDFGSVTDGSGITCGSVCEDDFPSGAQVVLSANPTDDGEFVEWAGDCSGSATTCVLTMSAPRSVIAVFGSAPTTTLAVRVSGGNFGSVSVPGVSCAGGCTATFRVGTVVTLSAEPNDSAQFLGWRGDCQGVSETCQLTMDSPKHVDAKFGPPPPAHLQVSVEGPPRGGA